MTRSLVRRVKIGGLELDGNIFLAPLAGYTDKVFRSLCIEEGAYLAFTELVSSEALARRMGTSFAMLERVAGESRLAPQLFGAKPAVFAAAVKALLPLNPSLIDINAGCPVPKVVKTEAGAALMKTPQLLGEVVRAVAREAEKASPAVPVSVKMRSGWDEGALNFVECAKIAEGEGAAMVTLHARSRKAGYEGEANWEHIARLTEAVGVPVCGSGGVWSADDALNMLDRTGCAAVMIARGAMGNPFIFREARALAAGQLTAPPSWNERVDMALRHLREEITLHGEITACRAMRAHFCKYIHGAPNAAKLRDSIVRAASYEEYAAALL